MLESQGADFPEPKKPDIYIGTMGEAAKLKSTEICTMLRNEGFIAVTDVTGRSVKAQMKYADKIGAIFSTIIGDNEINEGKCILKNMQSGEQREVTLDASLMAALYDEQISKTIGAITESADDLEKLFK